MKPQVVLTLLLVLVAGVATAGDAGSDDSKVVHRQPPVLRTIDGETVFRAYCSSCHGENAQGGGPARSYLEMSAPDLTQLQVREGKLDHGSLERRIAGRGDRELHVMPAWESILERTYSDRPRELLMLHNLARYIESIQAPGVEPTAGS